MNLKRNKDLCLPINYKMPDKIKISAPVSAKGADGYRVVETIDSSISERECLHSEA